METNSSIQSLVFTSLSVRDIRQLFRSEIESYFETHPLNAPPEDTQKLLTIQEASVFLKLTVNTIYGLTSRNELPFMKTGKRLYFSKAELFKFIRNGRKKTNEEVAKAEEQHLGNVGQIKKVATKIS
jgi:excisionase family DNA binding protein